MLAITPPPPPAPPPPGARPGTTGPAAAPTAAMPPATSANPATPPSPPPPGAGPPPGAAAPAVRIRVAASPNAVKSRVIESPPIAYPQINLLRITATIPRMLVNDQRNFPSPPATMSPTYPEISAMSGATAPKMPKITFNTGGIPGAVPPLTPPNAARTCATNSGLNMATMSTNKRIVVMVLIAMAP